MKYIIPQSRYQTNLVERIYYRLCETSKSFNGFMYELHDTDYIVRHVDPGFYSHLELLLRYYSRLLFRRKYWERYYSQSLREIYDCKKSFGF